MLENWISLWVYAFLIAFLNALYICIHGITIMDRYLSGKNWTGNESISPFDRFARMHRYCFITIFRHESKVRSVPVRIWIYITTSGLTLYWSTVIFIVVYKSFFYVG